MPEEYKEISETDLHRAYPAAWSIECMAGHDAEGRTAEYIGSTRKGHYITDYFRDSQGDYWYRTRIQEHGEILTMDEYLFGKKTRLRRKRKKERQDDQSNN